VEFAQTHKPIGLGIVCFAGTNLSPAFTVLLLHLLDGVSVEDAAAAVKRLEPNIRVHPEVKSILRGFLQGIDLPLP
jgi:predicted protein tyrosine phosphatase